MDITLDDYIKKKKAEKKAAKEAEKMAAKKAGQRLGRPAFQQHDHRDVAASNIEKRVVKTKRKRKGHQTQTSRAFGLGYLTWSDRRRLTRVAIDYFLSTCEDAAKGKRNR